MDEITIKKLNKINLDFYSITAKDFDDSRQYFWQGWNNLVKYFNHFNQLKLLDLGCGNARFFKFTLKNISNNAINYVGVDSNQELLDFAQEDYKNRVGEFNGNFRLQKNDIVNSLIKNEDFLSKDNFDIAVSFGVFHHIPSYELRLKLLEFMKSKIINSGYIIISLWQFMEFERFRKKIVNNTQNENNDFVLDWKKGKEAHRFCHFIDEEEQNRLIKQSNLQLVESFRADGKEGNVNTYLVLKKK